MAKHPDVKISLSGGGSGNGIKALIDSTTDIAMASRKMEAKEIDLAKSKGVTPKEIIVAKDAVAAMVNPANPVDGLTVQQLSDIYSGKITNWGDVGGNKAPIAVVSRDSSSGTFETWQELVVGKGVKVTPDALLQPPAAPCSRPCPRTRTPSATTAWAIPEQLRQGPQGQRRGPQRQDRPGQDLPRLP
jgi:phosphate transport system substrate-binding protein